MQNLFYILALSVFALMHWTTYRLFLRKLVDSKNFQRVLAFFVFANFLGVIVYFVGRYGEGIPKILYFWASLSIGLSFVLFMVALVHQFLFWITLVDKKRREALQKGLNLASGALACGYAGWGLIEGGLEAKVEKVSIRLDGLRKSFSAVQISDLHIGGLIGEGEIKAIVAKIATLRPDVVFLTGDIIDTKVSQAEKALEELGKLEVPLGVYYVLGNHEFFHGVHEVVEKVKSLGFHILQNQSVVLQKDGEKLVNLVGVNDLFGRRFGALEPDLSKALEMREGGLPSILLAHQPKFSREVKEGDGIDLILSGHTHGGQIFPFGIFVRLDQPYLAGLYQHSQNTQIYVNRGSGFWGPPMRVGSRAEITYFEFGS